jgi:hypothetical protein
MGTGTSLNSDFISQSSGLEETFRDQPTSRYQLRSRKVDKGNPASSTEGGLGPDPIRGINQNNLGRKYYLHHAQEKALKKIQQVKPKPLKRVLRTAQRPWDYIIVICQGFGQPLKKIRPAVILSQEFVGEGKSLM